MNHSLSVSSKLKTKQNKTEILCNQVDGLENIQNPSLYGCEILGWVLGEEMGSKAHLQVLSPRTFHLRVPMTQAKSKNIEWKTGTPPSRDGKAPWSK